MVISSQPNSENGRLYRDGNAFPSQTQNSSKKAGLACWLEGHSDENEVSSWKHDYESGAWQQKLQLPITVATQANSSRFQSFTNENENLSKVCQTFYLLE